MLEKIYSLEWNKKDNTWNVLIEEIRKDYIIKGLTDPKLAEQIVDALNNAYRQGTIDEQEKYQGKIKRIFGIQ